MLCKETRMIIYKYLYAPQRWEYINLHKREIYNFHEYEWQQARNEYCKSVGQAIKYKH